MSESKMTKVHHVSLAVKDAEKVIEVWSSMLGIGPWTCHDMAGTSAKGYPWTGKEYWAQVGDLVIELIQPVEGRIVQSKFLDTVGPGLHHIAFAVEDVEETLAELQDKGAELIIHSPGSFAYLKTGAPDGAVIEISKHS